MVHHIQQQNKHRNLLVVAVMLGFVLVFSGLFGIYIYTFKERMETDNRTRLAEVSSFITGQMNTVVTQTREALYGVADAVGALDTRQQRLDYLQAVSQRYSFAYMGYALTDGVVHSITADEPKNMLSESHFRKAINGTTTASRLVQREISGRTVQGIILVVPLRVKEVKGALVVMLEVNRFRAALQMETFGGEGAAYIIDRQGSVVLGTRNLSTDSFFDLWRSCRFDGDQSFSQVEKAIAAGKEGLAVYTNTTEERRYAYFRPLQLNDWMAVTVVSEQVVLGKTLVLAEYLVLLAGGTMLLFMGLLVWSTRSYRISMESRTAAEAKAAFLANMSHEIRTPMNAIVGISEILLRDELSPRHCEQIMSIRNSGKGLLTIINDILDISKIESGGFAVVEEPYELESLLYDLTIISVIRLGEKPVRFMVEVEADMPRVLVGDMGRVKQVLLNIVGNAIKFTQAGAIHVLLSAAREGNEWRIEAAVSDTGMGIKPDDLEKLFVRFSQVDTRRNRNVEGTGLGLTISQKLCELMGGGIRVTSRYGKGSTFTISLSQGVDEDDSLLVSAVNPVVSVLLCEPTPELRGFEIACLKQLGVRYELCGTQAAFVQAMRAKNFTHVLGYRHALRALPHGMKPQVVRVELLAQQEHAFIEASGTSVYVPLLATQLPYVLNGSSAPERLRHNTGMDVNDIYPMPHVSVLIVDDNDLNIQVAEGLMAPYCMRVRHALSGREALRMVHTEEFDLVLMDHMMPELDGVETLQLIRQLSGGKYSHLPVVALTANTTSEARQLFIEKGFDDFLAKPIETTRLNGVLMEWLKPLNAQRAAAQPAVVQAQPELSPEYVEIHNECDVLAPVAASECAVQATEPVAQASQPAFSLEQSGFTEMDFNAGMERLPMPGLYVKILRSYIVSTAEKLAALSEWMYKDANRVIIEVHGLKSASASIGAVAFSEAAQQLEVLGKAGDFETVRAGLPEFIEQGGRVIAEIERYLEHV